MSKFNRAATATRPAAPTFEGGIGFARNPKQDLFPLAVTNLAGEDTYYESAGQRDDRFRDLVHTVALEDAEWLGRFVQWLRSEANMRSASVVAACGAVWARLQAGLHGGNRQLIDQACRRADEPGEVLAYWTSRYGRAIPKPVKRGVADAVGRLYTEYSLAKYDGESPDMQTAPYLYHPNRSVDDVVPADIPVFGINTSGYAAAALLADKRNRFEVGGFSDKVFTMFGLLASGQDVTWPF